MAVKELFRRMRPVQLYVILALTILFFLTELVVSHVTHALTLLVDSYHMLCNLIALIGCIATVKYGDEGGMERGVGLRRGAAGSSGETLSARGEEEDEGESGGRRLKKEPEGSSRTGCMGGVVGGCHGNSKQGSSEELPSQSRRLVSERRLRNTFGWARIDVLVLMIGTVFLASLCFSLVVEAVQTLFHIGHSDEMHHPIPVMCIGAAGVLLNGLCYLLIGGYTFHQGSFLHVTPTGDVVLERAVSQDRVRRSKKMGAQREGGAGPSSPAAIGPLVGAVPALPLAADVTPAAVATSYLQAGISGTPPLRQGPREMFRDVVGCFLVIICSLVVYFTDADIAKYADPIISIVSAILLLVLSYPYMKESGLILLQTIPDHINIESLRSQLCDAFAPVVVGIHDLHIWQLTQQRTYATAHIVFMNSKEISSVMKQVTEFFHDQGITHVTIQPEFLRCSAISTPNPDSRDAKPHGLMLTSRSKSSYSINMERTASTDEPICFLKCAGRGASCRNLHCCDEAKGEPLALPHHHHHRKALHRRRHSLDEITVAEHGPTHHHGGPPVNHHPSSTSSPSLIARQKMPSRDEAVTCRHAVNDNDLEKPPVQLAEGQTNEKVDVDVKEGEEGVERPPYHTPSLTPLAQHHHEEEGGEKSTLQGRRPQGGEKGAEDDGEDETHGSFKGARDEPLHAEGSTPH
ncbi:proton-coupled zinc antiporter SLC30A1 [Hetaerina americana]|uniref:proton-coupled zinc antiporter SLC30A1 n=1 Tax=Hetaerina americana TaxID=62018 RepID=UPI003A7F5307